MAVFVVLHGVPQGACSRDVDNPPSAPTGSGTACADYISHAVQGYRLCCELQSNSGATQLRQWMQPEFMCEVAAACAGRIVSKRTQGKLIFYDLKAEGAKVQIMANSRSGGQIASELVPLQCGSCSAISLPTCLVTMK